MKSCIKLFKKENNCVKIITRSGLTGKLVLNEQGYGICFCCKSVHGIKFFYNLKGELY